MYIIAMKNIPEGQSLDSKLLMWVAELKADTSQPPQQLDRSLSTEIVEMGMARISISCGLTIWTSSGSVSVREFIVGEISDLSLTIFRELQHDFGEDLTSAWVISGDKLLYRGLAQAHLRHWQTTMSANLGSNTTYTHDMFYNYNRPGQWSGQGTTGPEEDRDRLRHHTYHLHNAPALNHQSQYPRSNVKECLLPSVFLSISIGVEVERNSAPKYD